MHARTAATLDQLERADWFSKVGVQDAATAVVLSSWDEALEHCGSVEWENLCLEACNQYRQRLLERSKEAFNQWNDVIEMIKTSTVPLVQHKIESVAREHGLPKLFEDTVQWDILNVCAEAEYADIYPPGFYASQAYWYVKGHFPCGWKGNFPDGTLIVY